jgi:DNA-binding NarL/FixJ family response regulator
MAESFIRDRADWVHVLEAAYAPVTDDTEWARRIIEVVGTLVEDDNLLGLTVLEHPPDCSLATMRMNVDPAGIVANARIAHERVLTSLGRTGFRLYCYPEAIVSTHLEVERAASPSLRAFMTDYRRDLGVADVMGIVTHPVPGTVVVLYTCAARPIRLTRRQRRLLTQIGIHLETSYRLRRRPEVVRAVIDPGGAVLHRTGNGVLSTELLEQTKRIERARTRKTRANADAIDLWTALVGGTMSVVERDDGGQRRYLVVENAAATQPLRAMTRGELDVVSMATRGLSAKLIAYALGIAPPTVSARLASAASKIGVASRIELVRLAAMLARDPRARFENIALTTAERDVLDLLASGLSNQEIATIRNRSVRTIANQVACLLRKTRSPTRRALVARAI